ncbi:hypothetical protein [Streptomyces sp. NRRL F-5755]|uniref:MmyB family transcriptional regulator n=1 Tax=Streptomyces sp. NRRL F-5755 TaxID=1519475 RepID=UPI002D21E0E1|nr:hypothetical protein [Streptomyces sp. NRRL F-5755]
MWNVVRANRAMDVLLGVASPELLAGEPNVIRLALHPQGFRRMRSTTARCARTSSVGCCNRSRRPAIPNCARCKMR